MVNKYFLKKLVEGQTVMLYEAELEFIKTHLKKEEPFLVNRVMAKKVSDSKYLECKIV